MKSYYGCLSYYNNINSRLGAVRHRPSKSQLSTATSDQTEPIRNTSYQYNQIYHEDAEFWFPKILHAAIVEYIYIPFNSHDKVYRN